MGGTPLTLPDHFLFGSEDHQTFLVDIPASIAAAQQFAADEGASLLSCLPTAEPYPNTEPKSAKAQAKVSNLDADEALHQIYAAVCTNSLSVLRAVIPSGPLCLPRQVLRDSTRSSRKRKNTADDKTKNHQYDATLCLQRTMKTLHEDDYANSHLDLLASNTENNPSIPEWTLKLDLTNASELEPIEAVGKDNSLSGYNTNTSAITVELEPVQESCCSSSLCLRIPPGSSWLLGSCTDVADFRRVARQYSPRGRFDLIYMDPPWPNRSALRHSSNGGGYRTENSPRAVQRLLSQMDLDIHIKPAGFVAVWITNKPACRATVMELFLQWNIVLVEEWIYLKLAANGEPITALSGKWRKPYEVLLIAQSPSDRLHHATEQPRIIRRTIAAVPDLHSRKPCLKQLFQHLLQWPGQERDVLEIFARHLVADWMSWGDEIIKYNWSHHWSSSSSGEDKSIEDMLE